MAKRPKKIVNIKSIPTPDQTMHTNTQFNLIPKIIPQASAEYQYVEKLNKGEIKTSFTPTAQQTAVLYAMEKQKLEEKQQPTQPKTQTMQIYDEGINVTLKLQKQIDEQKIRRAEQAQMALDFQTRTTEQALREHIESQLEVERTQDTDTNFTQYVSEYGVQKFVNDYETDPQAIFQADKLDTPQELLQAGVASRIVNQMIENQVVNQKETNVNTQNVNYTGISDDQISYTNQEQITSYQGTENLVFNPYEAQNQNNVVTNEAVTQVNYTGSGSITHQATDKETVHEVVTTEKAGLAKIIHNNPVILAIGGLGIMALGS